MEKMKHIVNARLVIKLVKSRPELYDQNNENFANRFAHATAWKALAKQMNVSVNDFKTKWSSLRASYARSLRFKVLYPDNPKPTWYLQNAMSFLKNHMQYKKSRPYLDKFADNEVPELGTEEIKTNNDDSKNSNIENNQFTESENQIKENLSFIEENHGISKNNEPEDGPLNDKFNGLPDIFNHADENKSESVNTKKKKSSEKFDKLYNSLNKFLNKGPNIIQEPSMPSTSASSADELFFRSIERDYNKLSDKKKRKCKLILLNSLNELLDETEEDFESYNNFNVNNQLCTYFKTK